MHSNDGTLAENWITERGGWQLDRVNKAFGYMLGTTQADQNVARALSGWNPKKSARLPSLHALEHPLRDRAQRLMALLFSCTTAFSETALNLDETVADCLVAILIMHYPDILILKAKGALVVKMQEAMAAQAIGEAEVLTWSASIRSAFNPPPEPTSPRECKCELSTVLELMKHQSHRIEVLVLQNTRLEERQLALEAQLSAQIDTDSDQPRETDSSASPSTQLAQPTVRIKKTGSQSLSGVWFEWFTAESRVYASSTVKKTALYEFRHIVGYMILFLPSGFALDEESAAFKSEVLRLEELTQQNALGFLKASGASATAAGIALKALRKLHNTGKLDGHTAQFHDRIDCGSVVDPTPAASYLHSPETHAIGTPAAALHASIRHNSLYNAQYKQHNHS